MILHLETSTSVCSVAISHDGAILSLVELDEPNKHAEVLTVFCERALREAGVGASALQAVSVSGGPGSYTGLRIGVSTAKGFCYALKIPLIAIDTLQGMAAGMTSSINDPDALFCPMIDARRMEVYCAFYDASLNTIHEVAPVVMEEKIFADILDKQVVWFSGDGMPKCKELLSNHRNARFTDAGIPSAQHLVALAEQKFSQNTFVDLAYYEPFYLKTFQPGPKRSA
ncbi:MAG: tRNA (adenosine(37)-N6)-threonylcarbamoyltransferase complex dimerization subunit type 1 TsaB [Bacteroidia bacterium]